MTDIYKDGYVREKMLRDGYVILDLFSEEEVRTIRRRSLELIEENKKSLPDRYFPVGQLEDYGFRNASTAMIRELVVPGIHRLFKQDAITVYSGTHLVKPRGINSFLSTHQDSSIVDEKRYNAVLFWCPLQPLNRLNGQLYILKGSHLFGNHYRSTTIPWMFRGNEALLYKYSKPVNVRPGQICLFHSAIIHHSGYNFLTKYRIAVSSFISDREAALVNYYFDKEAGMIEEYEVDNNYYHNNNFNERPVPPAKLVTRIPYDGRAMSAAALMELIKKYALT